MQEFRPFFRNPHVLTILANFASRTLDERSYPVESRYFQTEPGVEILVHVQRPRGNARGELVLVHGLEGSSNAGYFRSMAQLALEAGFVVYRTNMRSCGGTEHLCRTMYHAGLTSDTRVILEQLQRESPLPRFLIGYSLGGNVALKLAGELGSAASSLLHGVCAVSTPIDLAASVRQMSRRANRIYENRFLSRLKRRVNIRARTDELVKQLLAGRPRMQSVYEFDDEITAKYFGFGSADNYYDTQSSIHFLPWIQISTLLVQAKDDPLIPFGMFESDAVQQNAHIKLIAAEHGGHLGFVASSKPRFWVDRVILEWILGQLTQ